MRPSLSVFSAYKKIVLLYLLLGLSSCGIFEESAQMEEDHVFEIAVLSRDMKTTSKGLGQDWQTAWPVLQSSYPDDVAYIVNEYDIDRYAWSEQEITLTIDASKKITQEYFIDLKDCNQLPAEKECLLKRAFVVVYRGSAIYGGIFLEDLPLATRFQYPIIYPKIIDNGRVIFTIRPYNAISNNYPYATEDWNLIRDLRIKDLFGSLGKLIR